jgi:hypothetical protein
MDKYSLTDPKENPADEGAVATGCAIGCGVQVLFLTAIPLALSTLRVSSQATDMASVLFGLTQWIVLGPVIWKLRGKQKTIIGIIITGTIGFMLSSACAAIVWPR